MGAIRDAHIATDPWLYYPLDDGTLVDIGSNSHTAALSGDTDLNALGVVRDELALHMGTTGAITSDTLGMNTLGDFSMGCYFMMAPISAWNAYRPLMTIGLAGTTVGSGWGGGLGVNGVSGATPTPLGVGWPSSNFASGAAVSQPVGFWHHLAMTYTASSRSVTCFTDGAAGSATIMPITTQPFRVSDRLVVSWPFGQCVISHVAFWRFLVTPAMFASIGGFSSNWPPNQQIQVGGGGGGDGGGGGTVLLGDPQAGQLTDIQTKVADIPGLVDAVNFISDTVNHIKGITDDTNVKVGQIQTDVGNIVNTLFPQLADVLNDIGAQVTQILDGITSTITNLAGTVTTTIGKFFDQHSKDVLGQFNPTGGPTCEQIDWNIGGASYFGVTLTITTRPQRFWPVTPDKQWTYPDLAVIRIYISGELILREPVHLNSHSIRPLPGMFPAQVAGIGVPIAPGDYHIIVDFADGVCGYIELDYLPT